MSIRTEEAKEVTEEDEKANLLANEETTKQNIDGNHEQEAPPTYESLFEKAKRCSGETAESFSFFHSGATILIGTTACTGCLIFMLALPITSIVLGGMYLEECPKQRFIPIYLIVMGSFSICRQLFDLFERHERDNDRDENCKHLTCSVCQCILAVINLFLFCWFVTGNVWIYSAYKPNYTNPTADDYCHKTLYLFAFWITTAVYIVMGTVCCCISCLGCGSLCWSMLENRE